MAVIKWTTDVSGSFSTAADWEGGVVPGPSDRAILDAAGGVAYTVTSAANQTVDSIETAANATLSITGDTFTATDGTGNGANNGSIIVDAANFDLGGTFDNVGSLDLLYSPYDTLVNVGASGATLTGGGVVNFATYAILAGGALTNVDNTLTGDVILELNSLTNDAGGVIDGTDSSYASVITIDGNATNSGLIEDTGGTQMGLAADYIYNTGGEIYAANGTQFGLGGIIVGGTLATAGSGVLQVIGILDGTSSTLDNKGSVVAPNGKYIELEGAIDNSGTIFLDSAATPSENEGAAKTYLYIGAGGVTLSGSGDLVLSNSNGNIIRAYTSEATLTNVDNTISGSGRFGIGGDALGFTNEAGGVLDADDSIPLVLQTGSAINDGRFEATGSGGLVIETMVIDDDGGGTITAAAAAKVFLEAADIEGGALSSTGTGVVEVRGLDTVLDGSSDAVALAGRVFVLTGASLTGEGAIDNGGILRVNGAATLEGPLRNTGTLETAAGTLTVERDVAGAGDAVIDGGTLTFASKFSEAVTFDGSGTLALGEAASYGGTISRFATNGDTALDLEDIGFAGAGEATFSGTASGGVLTVVGSNGTAHIDLKGDYLGVTFTAASADGGAASVITASTTADVTRFVQAAAAFAPTPGPTPLQAASASQPSAGLALASPALTHR